MRVGAARGAVLLLLLSGGAACRERAVALLQFDASTGPPPAVPPDDAHEVHFTYTGPTSVAFDWRGEATTVRYWTHGQPPRTADGHAPSPQPISSPGPFHEALLDGLTPGAEYFYEVGHPLRPVPATFLTPPAKPATFVFAAVGDMGTPGAQPASAGVNKDIAVADPSFVLMLGDLSYADLGSQAAVDRHFEDVMVWSRRAAYMPVWGNHEWEDPARDDLRNYKGRFALPHPAASPGAPAAGCCGEDWYWFDFGPVRFIIYPEPYAATTWPDWARRVEPLFQAAEADPKISFVVTAGHRPAYSSGHHGGDPRLRAILDGFGQRFPKYVLNLNGHSHTYERTNPQQHVLHVTVGIGGGALEHAVGTGCLWDDCKQPAFTAYRAIHHGFLKVTASADELRLEAICGPTYPQLDDVRCTDGEILDDVVIARGGLRQASEQRRRHPEALFQ
ncbi:MAG TPA: metallophosphoesterase [Polyangia bacterium]|nr:metallophosphoesterase [Polyangia bacterium]